MSTAAGFERTASFNQETKLHVIRPGYRSPIFVVFTTANRTLKALEKAGQLADPLKNRIEILAMHAVPFIQPLDERSVPFQFLVRCLEEMAGRFPAHSKVSACLCRDSFEALQRILNKNCPVVIGVGKRWWPTRDARLAAKLRRAGYKVVPVETGRI